MTQTSVSVLADGVAEGAEFAHVRQMFDRDEASKRLGITITELGLEEVRGNFTIRPEMCNGHGTAQGGMLFTFADSLFAGACNAPGRPAVAAQVSIHYIAPAREGDVVEGVAVTRQSWGRNGVTDVTLTSGGRAIAEFRGTFRVVKAV
ncbi:hydroxyphenylacetyl-CoA thioesterase PaaI [Corynebacterium halotolerans]|uniref:hydroxyphenylacetyl-CoA thioesterase PaaI n=1 Tax=Corynebacterium halotolerans TaxID=225326 RepID=UPI003CF90E5D